jgi:hypothetical protein
MMFGGEVTPSSVASSRSRVAALVAVFAAALLGASPAMAHSSTAPAGHPGNSGNAGNGSNSNASNAGSKGKPTTTPATPGHGAPTSGSAHGIAQTVGSASVVLAELDGSTVSVTIRQGTRVFVDGSNASLGDVKPGFVVTATWIAGKTKLLEAFSPGGVEVGVVASVLAKAIVVTLSDGSPVRVRIGPRTRVFLEGDTASVRSVKAGDTVVYSATLKPGSPAAVLRFLSPG